MELIKDNKKESTITLIKKHKIRMHNDLNIFVYNCCLITLGKLFEVNLL